MQCWHLLRDSPKWGAWRLRNNDKRKTPKKRTRDHVESSESDVATLSQVWVLRRSYRKSNTMMRTRARGGRPHGASKAKMERANLAPYARQVKAAERAVSNAEMRIKVAQEQLDLSLFSIAINQNDHLAAEFLLLKKQSALQRLRAEMLRTGGTEIAAVPPRVPPQPEPDTPLESDEDSSRPSAVV
ncbi:hypothetical protein PF008_g12825 [Phytophthora fragariae]|uniref:No apical meristem-associated C-terminal domain-containing protein n=1 Tax=Phytophthora fragariae TaxID=53985 RepID=A0A6G0RM91_9STRA|nr:hypothetical protein PF008_g12825 [Phytophthora fragariae]